MHYLYIIYSKSKNRYYVGESVNPDERLIAHNNHKYSLSYTKIANDWKIVLSYPFEKKEQALKAEKFIKKMKSKQFLKKNNSATRYSSRYY